MDDKQILLSTKDIPTAWYNINSDLPEPPPPFLHPATGEPMGPDDLRPLFPMALIMQEVSTEKWIEIPPPVREKLALWRPTPLVRARNLEQALKTPARIYFKNESVSPPGSHKPNTAVAQAYYNAEEGIKTLSTETGAGQWGSSLAFATSMFGIECRVFMVRISYEQKPYRRTMMHTWGANVVPSPSPHTQFGRALLEKDPECTGSLGIAISEAVEIAAGDEGTHYSLGSVLGHVCLHQSVIGLETRKQLELAGDKADVVIGCAGGGSNFAGIAFPFAADTMAGKGPRLVAVEPSACPSLTRGRYAYDFGDTAGMAPIAPMFTLGHNFVPSGIHAGGLRYHGMSPLVSLLRHKGLLDAVAYHQNSVFEAATLFAQTEGIIPAPETAHAVRGAIDEAIRCREAGEEKCIVFNLSGHGYMDLSAYDAYQSGELEDFELSEDQIGSSLSELPKVPEGAAP